MSDHKQTFEDWESLGKFQNLLKPHGIPFANWKDQTLKSIYNDIVERDNWDRLDTNSLYIACMNAANFGLIPGIHGYFNIFKEAAQFMLKAAGVDRVAQRQKHFKILGLPVLVLNDDEFRMTKNADAEGNLITQVEHELNWGEETWENIRGAYMYLRYNGQPEYIFMSVERIMKIMNMQKPKAQAVWKQHPGEMAKNSVRRQIMKYCDFSDFGFDEGANPLEDTDIDADADADLALGAEGAQEVEQEAEQVEKAEKPKAKKPKTDKPAKARNPSWKKKPEPNEEEGATTNDEQEENNEDIV